MREKPIQMQVFIDKDDGRETIYILTNHGRIMCGHEIPGEEHCWFEISLPRSLCGKGEDV